MRIKKKSKKLACRLDNQADRDGPHILRQLEAEERAAGLQAVLSNSESKRLGLEKEVTNLRSTVDQLCRQPSTSSASHEAEQRLREASLLLGTSAWHRQRMLPYNIASSFWASL